jgi:hypothetical protein
VSGSGAKRDRAGRKPPPRASTGWGAYEAGHAATIALKADVAAYFSRVPARITADPRDPMNLLGQEPWPPEWGDQMFVALQFLRSTLEYVALDLVMAYAPDANPSRTGFPVAKTEEDWSKSGGHKRVVANMHPGAAEIIDGLQPFNDVSPGYTSTLEGLHHFARIYRHRRPPILITAQRGRGVLHTDYRHPRVGTW